MMNFQGKKLMVTLAVAISAIMSGSLFAEEPRSDEEPHSSGVTEQTSLNFVLASTLEMKAKLTETVTVPMLRGDGALTKDNSLKLSAAAELSPVSVNGTLKATLTPIAFLQFSASGGVGTGWNIPIASGLRMVELVGDHDTDMVDASFDGVVWYGEGGGLFQFDLAAVVPGKWNHVVFQTYHGARYRALSSAAKDDSWLWEADSGENRNGWYYYGNYFLGYQMPLKVSMAGLLFEETLNLYDTANRADWGDDVSRWVFGPLVNFDVTERFSFALLCQMQTKRNFTGDTGDYEYYQKRVLDTDDPRRVEFYRAAINATIKLD